MKQLSLLILVLSLVSVSCQGASTLQAPEATQTASSPLEATIPAATQTRITDIRERLAELGGEPCEVDRRLTCVTIAVPLDHVDPANQETVEVMFAIAPAQGERKGMYVRTAGGPGGEGIGNAFLNNVSDPIRDSYDIVVFDQRGVGLSSPLECKNAIADSSLEYWNEDDSLGQEGYDTPEEQQKAIQSARTFVDRCIAEIGIDPEKLKFFTTDQVAEDLEFFRQIIGDEKFMLYGISYGTSVAQTYARAHPEHLSGLILDGTVDTTLSGEEFERSRWEAFNMVLLEVFEACDADSACSSLMGGSAQAVYDELAQRLAAGAIPYEYVFPGGEKVKHNFTLHMLEFTVILHLYGLDSRMALLRALAAAKKGNLIPLARQFFEVSDIDPATGEYQGDPNFSYTILNIVWCGDYAYFRGTTEERVAQIMQEIQKQNGLIPRLDNYPDLSCPYWPHAPASSEVREPLRAEGVPTFVLNATLDPATPFHEGKTVFENLENGYHLYVEGGMHGVYGWSFSCPDQYIEDFLVQGTFPDQREIVCDWGEAVLGR
jgi:pimeloyl-ACP methyl ester carboxylesterase